MPPLVVTPSVNRPVVLPHSSIGAGFSATARLFPNRPFLTHPDLSGSSAPRLLAAGRPPAWKQVTFAQMVQVVGALTKWLSSLGLEQPQPAPQALVPTTAGPRIAVLSNGRPEWFAAQLAAFTIGAVIVPIVPKQDDANIVPILQDSAAAVIFAENMQQVTRLQNCGALNLASVRHVVCFERRGVAQLSSDPRFHHFSDVSAGGFTAEADGTKPLGETALPCAEVDATRVAAILYTSGTTGAPKGVMLTHGMLLYVAEAAHMLGLYRDGERILAMLPPAHAYLFTVSVIAATRGLCLCIPAVENTKSSKMSRSMPQLMLRAARADTIPLIPQVLDKLRAKLLDAYAQAAGYTLSMALAETGISRTHAVVKWSKAKLFACAVSLGRWRIGDFAPHDSALRSSAARMLKRSIGRLLSPLSTRIARIGLKQVWGKPRLVVTGSAKTDPRVLHFFRGIFGVRLLEGYGPAEATAITSLDTSRGYNPRRIGAVGRPIPGVTVAIESAPGHDGLGWVVIEGPTVAPGYWTNGLPTASPQGGPGFERTAHGLRLHIGDLGAISPHGDLCVAGRAGDHVKSSTGKLVDLGAVERALVNQASAIPIAAAVAIALNRPHVIAIVEIADDVLKVWAQKLKVAPESVGTHSRFLSTLQQQAARIHDIGQDGRPRDFTQASMVRAVLVAHSGLPKTGLLKIRRHEVLRMYQREIDALYARLAKPHAAPAAARPTYPLRIAFPYEMRPLAPSDRSLLQAFFAGLPRQTVYERFFGNCVPARELERLLDPNPCRFAVIGFFDTAAHKLAGICDGWRVSAAVDGRDRPAVEMALLVSPEAPYRNRGIGIVLTQEMLHRIKNAGIRYMTVDHLDENRTVPRLVGWFAHRKMVRRARATAYTRGTHVELLKVL